jgi:hypothetical protein
MQRVDLEPVHFILPPDLFPPFQCWPRAKPNPVPLLEPPGLPYRPPFGDTLQT